jgi:hypothetical protein
MWSLELLQQSYDPSEEEIGPEEQKLEKWKNLKAR